MMEFLKSIPIQAIYAVVAVAGGMARYLNSFAEGQTPFKISIFLASAFTAGFSGLMFALLGDAWSLPNPIPHIMAGCGGFFGEQTMKYIMEQMTKRKPTVPTQQ